MRGARVALCLGWCVAAGGAVAGLPESSPGPPACPPCETSPLPRVRLLPQEPPAATLGKNFFLPVLNIAGVQAGYMLFNRFALNAPYAMVTLDAWKYNLQWNHYEYDNDILFLNQFGHPYQGSFAMASARAYGLGFWES